MVSRRLDEEVDGLRRGFREGKSLDRVEDSVQTVVVQKVDYDIQYWVYVQYRVVVVVL